MAHCLRRTGGGDWGAVDRGEGVNDGVVEGAAVGGTTATEGRANESPTADCMKEAARGEGAVGGTVTDCNDNDDDDTTGSATFSCATVTEDEEACGHTELLDLYLASAEDGGGDTIMGRKTGFEEVEAGVTTVLLDCFLAVARASLSLLLQEEQVLRGDHSPCLSLP